MSRVANVKCGLRGRRHLAMIRWATLTKSGRLAWNLGYTGRTNHCASGSGATYHANGNLGSDGTNTELFSEFSYLRCGSWAGS